jgi:predicted ribosomally synthesized peptide with nif11-like leader
MSIESAKAFMERMNTDKEFAKIFFACKDQDTARHVIIAEGFDFTREELKSLQQELSDEALESVAGGLPGWMFCATT